MTVVVIFVVFVDVVFVVVVVDVDVVVIDVVSSRWCCCCYCYGFWDLKYNVVLVSGIFSCCCCLLLLLFYWDGIFIFVGCVLFLFIFKSCMWLWIVVVWKVNRLSKEYENEVIQFIEFAGKKNPPNDNQICWCPYKNCFNTQKHPRMLYSII